ncbi:helix-turn-helix domain-containing protein [Halomonas sp. OfavH-34-E]|uniref:helix-turn-helix domain-containing protein n=1 Tax=Halomonas sp. OfavH-34-E TaxID=2954491 RepID=UPI00343B40AE
MQKVLLTYNEAAEMLGVSHWTVRRWANQGALRTVSSGKGRKVTLGSIRRLADLDAGAPEYDAHSAPGVQKMEKTACHTEGRGHRTGGPHTKNAAKELDALLAQRT